MNSLEQSERANDIAIIGMAGRFPGAQDVKTFWRNLREGVESITFLTDEELAAAGVSEALRSNPQYVKAASVLEGSELFDAAFFGVSPREAETMDPQHRLFLEIAWEAFENAGYAPEEYEGLISVYASAGFNRYMLQNLVTNPDLVESLSESLMMIGNDKDFLATRVSYKLNLKGAGIMVQTACSSSLVAVHMASQSLLGGECDMALAGGVSVAPKQHLGYLYREGGVASADGHTRTFDQNSSGTVFGNGVGAVVLKRYEDAVADGDFIYATIKGSAINNDGSQKVTYTAPSVEGQISVIAEALALSGVESETIQYVEAHGTGTALGDPIEVEALTRAFRESTDNNHFCAIGSVKSNVGHLDVASGVTGLIKTVLALHHGEIPPSLHYERPNPKIDFENSPFFVNTELTTWNTGGEPRRAGVSSFGFGGTNAHVVLEQSPEQNVSSSSRERQLLVLSAKTDSALEQVTENLATHLQEHPEQSLADTAYTLQVGRKAFGRRRILVASDTKEAIALLKTRDPKRVFTGGFDQDLMSERQVAFMFTGSGSNYLHMARDLYESEPFFQEQVDECCELLLPVMGMDLRDALYPKPGQEGMYDIYKMEYAQPALFIIEYALAQLLISFGIKPKALIGHSTGQYVAACIAGVFSLEDALKLVAHRGRLFEELADGAMLAVNMPEAELLPLLGPDLSLATVNAPNSCVVAGSPAAIASLEQEMTRRDVSTTPLHLPSAAHSHLVEPILDRFAKLVSSFDRQPPQIPMISNVSGTWLAAEEATDPYYWARHLRETVRFADGIRELCQNPYLLLLEVGPGKTLSSFAMQSKPEGDTGRLVLTTMRHVNDQRHDVEFLLETIGKLWLCGVPVDWQAFYEKEDRCRMPLPTYPFERQRYWIEPSQTGLQSQVRSNSIGSNYEFDQITDWFYVPLFKQSLSKPTFEAAAFQAEKRRWLLLADSLGVGEHLAKQLRKLGQEVMVVSKAAQFAQLDGHSFTIDPKSSLDYDELVRELHTKEQMPQEILHLWSLQETDEMEDSEAFEQAQQSGAYSLLFLMRAFGKTLSTEPIRVHVISSGLWQVESTDRLCPEKTTMLGVCKVMGQEYPHFVCRAIDVKVTVPDANSESKLDPWTRQLLAELQRDGGEQEVALRGTTRWVQTYEQVPTTPIAGIPTRLRKNGVYFLTGGLGQSIGFPLACYLAEKVSAKLVLTGRTELPPREEWSTWLSERAEDEIVYVLIRRLLELEEKGAQVLYVKADVAEAVEMQAAVRAAIDHFGEIHGVIHAAGVYERTAFTPMSETGYPEFKKHFASKVHGVRVLAECFGDIPIDFCFLASSLSAVLGGTGFVAHAAAHLFMDAFAKCQNQTDSFPWICVNWDLDVVREQPEVIGQALSIEESGLSLTVSKTELNHLLQQVMSASFPIVETSGSTSGQKVHPRPNLLTPYQGPTTEMEELVGENWEGLLGITGIGIHDNFFELGGNSLLGTKLVTRLRATFQIDLPLRLIFEANTVAEMALYIEDALIAEIEQLSDEELSRLGVS